MSDENLAMTVAADPQLIRHYIDRTQEEKWAVPFLYDREIEDIIKTPIALIPTIDTPEDYKTLVAAINIVKTCKQRVATIRHHLKALHYHWSNLERQASKFVETKYYNALSSVRAEAKKSIVVNAIEPITSGVEQLEHLLANADIAQKHLDDLNWAVKNSSDLVVNYFNAIKVFMPREQNI